MPQTFCKVTPTKERWDSLVRVQNVANFKHQACLKFFTEWRTLLHLFIIQKWGLKTKQKKPKTHVLEAPAHLCNEQTRLTLLTGSLDTDSGKAMRSPSEDSEVQGWRLLSGRGWKILDTTNPNQETPGEVNPWASRKKKDGSGGQKCRLNP